MFLVQEFLCRAANRYFTVGYPSVDCRNKGPAQTPPPGGRPWAPTDLKAYIQREPKYFSDHRVRPNPLSAPPPQVMFLPDTLPFFPSALTNGEGWTALTVCAIYAHVAHTITNTAAPNTATSAATRSGKINSNHTLPIEFPTTTPRLPSDLDGEVTLAAISRENNRNLEHVESPGNLPTILANTLELAGYIRELELMNEVSEEDINAIFQPIELFTQNDKIDYADLTNTETA